MNTLIGLVVGIVAMAVIMGMFAAIGTLVFYNVDNNLALLSGLAVGVIFVMVIVAYLA